MVVFNYTLKISVNFKTLVFFLLHRTLFSYFLIRLFICSLLLPPFVMYIETSKDKVKPIKNKKKVCP